ncbi:MAG: hypothetical protein ACO1OC_02880 [Tuberibacillus sp.]
MKKGYFVLFIVVFALLMFPPGTTAKADTDASLKVNVEAGLSNEAKDYRSYPIVITIKNNGNDFKGDLVVTVPKDYTSFYNKIFPLKISSGTTKVIKFTMPGFEQGLLNQIRTNNQPVNLLHIFKGDWEDGNEIKLGKAYDLMPSFVDPTELFIGTLTNSPDSLNNIKLSSFQNKNPRVLAIKKDNLPEEGNGLAMFDVIVVNDFDLRTLSKKQSDALKEWVLNGGNLIVGSDVAAAGLSGEWASILPFSIKGDTVINDVKMMNDLSNEPLSGPLRVQTGTAGKSAHILYGKPNLPLVIAESHGLGQVIQAAIDLGDPVFSNWKSAPVFYEHIFQQTVDLNLNNPQNNMAQQNLRAMSEDFKTNSDMPIGWLALLFVVYLILITFVSYLILKKMDKREWSWVIIPVFAICCSLILYGIGAKGRIGNYQARSLSVLFLNDTGYATGVGNTAFLSHSGGHYRLEVKGDGDVEPGSMRNIVPTNTKLNKQFPFVHSGGESTVIDYQNIAFWSPESAEVNYKISDFGTLVAHLTFNGQSIEGTVKNNTKYTIEQAAIYSSFDQYKIGTLKPGEEKKVAVKVSSGAIAIPQPSNSFGSTGRGNRNEVMNEAINLLNINKNDGPVLGGFISQPLNQLTINGKTPKVEAVTAVLQPIDISYSKNLSGPVSFQITDPELSGDLDDYRKIMDESVTQYKAASFGSGTHYGIYRLPRDFRDLSLEVSDLKVEIPSPSNGPHFPQQLKMSIYNNQTGKYEEWTGSEFSKSGKDAEDYINANGEIKIRMIGSGDTWLPVLTVKGEVGHD